MAIFCHLSCCSSEYLCFFHRHFNLSNKIVKNINLLDTVTICLLWHMHNNFFDEHMQNFGGKLFRFGIAFYQL